MEASEKTNPLCKSVFKNGKSTLSSQEFTRQWINLVNAVERGKSRGFENEK